MSLTSLLLAWALVSALFLLWEAVSMRLSHAGNAGGWLRAPARIYIAEALVLTKNPYESIANTRSIQYVMARGNLMPADSLRRGF